MLLKSSATDGRLARAAASPLARVHFARDSTRLERIASLDALRGLMAWAVALYHFGLLTRAFDAGSWMSSVSAVLGLHSVEAFFMISGFCLFYLHGNMRLERTGLRRFYWQRFVRIAPVFYLVLASNLLLREPAGPPFTWPLLLENLTFTFGAHHPNRAMVIGGWSIGLEALFYAAFPLLALLFRSIGLLLCSMLMTIGLAWSYSAFALGEATDVARFNAYVVIQNHAFAFLLGGAIAKLRALTAARISTPLAAAVACIALGLWIASRPSVRDHFEVVLGLERATYVLASFLLVAMFALTRAASSRAQRWLTALGELSYPVYLLHPLAWVISRAWLPQGTPPYAALGVALGTTLALSLVVYHCYELPIRQRLAIRAPGHAVRSV